MLDRGLHRRINTAKRQSVLIRLSSFQRHVGHGVRRGLIDGYASASHDGRDTKAKTLVAAWLVSFEWPREVSCAAQRGISWHSLVIQANKHTVVMRRTFIEDAFGNTIADHVNADSPALQVQLYMMCSAGACREHKLLLLCSFGLRHIAWSFLFQHISHRLQKRHTFHMDEIVQRAFPSYIPAFPVPQAGTLADLKAVVAAKLKFSSSTAHQLIGTVSL